MMFRIRLELRRIVFRIAPLFVTIPRFILPFPWIIVREIVREMPVPVAPPAVGLPVATLWLVLHGAGIARLPFKPWSVYVTTARQVNTVDLLTPGFYSFIEVTA